MNPVVLFLVQQVGLAALVFIAIMSGIPIRNWIAARIAKHDTLWNVPDDPNVKAVCDLIRDHPEEWTIGDYFAEHKQGMNIWVANWDLVWAREIKLPGGFIILHKADDCTPTRNHRAVHLALVKLKALKAKLPSAEDRATMNYIAMAERERGDGAHD